MDKGNIMSNDSIDYLIIGNSASGLAAAESIRELDGQGRIVILTEEEYENYSKPLITYYLAGRISAGRIYLKEESFYRENNIGLLTGARVISINTGNNSLKTEDGRSFEYIRLLIASGGKPIVPEIRHSTAGKERKKNLERYIDGSNYGNIGGIFTLTTLKDAIAIKEYIGKNKIDNICILGGGLIGLKSAEAFLETGMKITIIELADRILAATFDREASGIIENTIRSAGNGIYTGNTIEEIFTDNGRISGCRLKDGSQIECGMLIIAVGVVPGISITRGTGIKTSRGILVDDHMKTSVKNVYASGDVVESMDILLGENRNIAIWPLAVRQGYVAGNNMAGGEKSYSGGFFMNSVEILGIPSVSMGLTNVEASGDGSVEVKKELKTDRRQYKKVVIRDNRISGLIMVGNIERAGIYAGLIKNRIDISGIKQDIFREDFGILHLPSNYRKHLVVGEGIEV
ncbi:MAG: NAD(P)/FAD-dependent oxidoreductase [Actinobacteria bacterium]|nr:NAD(P)/FAD-dependent oxidoreductase [Actinomycetota bacterium]